MNAFVLQAPGRACIETVPDPVARPGDVLLQVRMVGFCGSDLNSFRGLSPLVSYPRILGHEVCATVLQGDSEMAAGTDVALLPYSNCGAVPREKLYRARLTPKELCLVEPLTVGFHAVARGSVSAEDTVAIFGCGGVGLGAVAAASLRGARTICVDVDDKKLELAQFTGGGQIINSAREPLSQRLLELTDGRGPDVVIEAVGTPGTFRAAVEEVAFTGRVVYIGYAKEPVSYETRLFVQKELEVLGSRNAQPEDFRAVIGLLEARKFPVDQVVSLIVGLDEAPDALRSWSENPSRFQKIQVCLD